jgi:gamma-glutamylcyclotransferase (GGCT)/AIG2-like uncharacterized protein YtfP
MAHLFVYGTLRPEASDPAGRRARERLAAESRPIGPAATHGLLYDLGRYPGLWCAGDGRVVGSVVELAGPQATFAWLDLYEGGEYERVRRQVALEAGGVVEAWLYALRRRPTGAASVQGGDWMSLAGPRSTALKPRVSSPSRQFRRSRT